MKVDLTQQIQFRFSVLAIPACVYAVTRNKDTTKVLYCGWTPVIIAMSISRCDHINSFFSSDFQIEEKTLPKVEF